MKVRRLLVLAAVVSILAPLCLAGSADDKYIHEDAKISGKEIHSFVEDGQQVSVVLGSFKLELGETVLTSRDAVIWISSQKSGPSVFNDITVYLEGKARIVEQRGAQTTDQIILVTLFHDGKIHASGTMSQRPLDNFPLYLRAKSAKQAREQGYPQRKVEDDSQAVPLLIFAEDKDAADALTDLTPTTTPAEDKWQVEATSKSEDLDVVKVRKVEKKKEVHPVAWQADSFTSEMRGDTRITIAKGNVYLSQGDPRSELFLELRSQVAVIFSGKVPAKQSRSPYSPKIKGVDKDFITGVYLDGDVIIARGERYMRAPRAYYDFALDRAIVLDPVFRTIQKQREIPIYVRAKEARLLSAREVYFKDAKVSTSDFYSPSYHIGAKSTYFMDNTPYDEEGERLGERSWLATMKHTTFNVRSVPLMYLPSIRGNLTEGNSPLRKAQFGKSGRFGVGVETQWHLFRLLGLLEPEGVKGRLNLDWYERGVLGGIDLDYARREKNRQYSGFVKLAGLSDDKAKDKFGDVRDNISAPDKRGRALARHKEFLAGDWTVQLEFSYITDRNFLEEFYPSEFFAGKEQDTLAYAKKQTDNWALTALAQTKINRFQTQTESAPDVEFYMLGQPLLKDRLTFYSESRAGWKRFRARKGMGINDSSFFGRFDTRNEIDMPLDFGPLSVVPYVVGRATYWSDDLPVNGEKWRPYGQVGVKSTTHIWKVYDGVNSRIWDLNRLKHIISPYVSAWIACSDGVEPGDLIEGDPDDKMPKDSIMGELFPIDPDIEEFLDRSSGLAFGLHQRLQTKRGRPGQEETVDWMRLNVNVGIYDNGKDRQTSDGRFFWYRPEHSIARNHVNADYTWNISDSTSVLADTNYDIDDGDIDRFNAGLAVQRDPRLRYYLGTRYIREVDSFVGTAGFNYKISRKYSVSAFEQYDFDFDGGKNMATSFSIIRKLPRWFAGVTFVFNQADGDGDDEIGMFLTLWPEGIPEVRIGGDKFTLMGQSSMN